MDGVNVPTVAFTRSTGANPTIGASTAATGSTCRPSAPPTGALWASAALPGKVNDITAARRHGLAKKIGPLLGVLADLGYVGLDDVTTGFRKPRGGQLTPAQREANRLHAALRFPATRQHPAEVVSRAGHRLRCRPSRCTRMGRSRAHRVLPRAPAVRGVRTATLPGTTPE